MQFFSLLALIMAWIGYFLIHSLLASHWIKAAISDICPRSRPYYRLLYNLFAVILLIPPLLILYASEWSVVWVWQGYWEWVMSALLIVSIGGFIWSLGIYQGLDFSGIASARGKPSAMASGGEFRLSTLHRYTRHPWYTLALVIVWSRDMNTGMLTTAVLMSLYFVIGSWLEERKLEAEFGETYQRYKLHVPGLIPRPWRMLSAKQAAQLTGSVD